MGIFDSIMSKLGFGDKEETNNEAQGIADIPPEESAETSAGTMEEADTETPRPQVEAITVVDVVAKLETLSSENPGLNWQTSIVDLMKLLGLDSSYAHRKELAAEMGIDNYEGTAEQNIALHKAVLTRLAQNGGNIPQELLA